MERHDYLIIGGGLAAAAAVDGIRERDPVGSIVILGEESEPPYHRPPLSKEYVRTPTARRDMLHVKPERWFEEEGRAEVRTATRAVSLDAADRSVGLAGGETVAGERLLLATGGRPRTLPVPGVELEGVFTLRTVDDAEAIRAVARRSEHAVLIGAGFIGMELAASLAAMDVSPVVVEQEARVWPRLLPPGIAEFIRSYLEERGVRFRLSSRVEALQGPARVRRVLLEDGVEIPCDLVVVGIGIRPNVELAAGAGLAVQDGVVVDKFGETSHAHIYAAGDVARFPDPVFGDACRVEHWDHAKAHGRCIGRNMAGDRTAYDHLSYFFSDVFDLSLNVFGRPAEADRTVVRGDVGTGRALVFCAAEERIVGVLAINAPDALDECRDLVRRRAAIAEVQGERGDSDAAIGELVG